MLKLSIAWSCLWLRSADVKNNAEELRDIKYCNIYLYPINWRIFFKQNDLYLLMDLLKSMFDYLDTILFTAVSIQNLKKSSKDQRL